MTHLLWPKIPDLIGRRVRYGSVCSGIEAASAAWHRLGWEPAWFSQFDPEHEYESGPDYPSAVLARRYPSTPNLGSIVAPDWMARAAMLGDIDVLVGGTPCQAFSVSGLRGGLEDPRGQLTLRFVEIANAADPSVIVWENVPGVLTDKTNAFGCLLAGLAGEDVPLEPPGRRWTNAGYVSGPQRTVAWRTLDAQYSRVAQRRRRVFVVACPTAGNLDPAAILFEFDGVRRDSPPSRSTGQEAADRTTSHSADGRFHADIAPCIDASYGRLQGCSGQDALHGHSHLIAFDTTQITSALNRSNPQPGDPCHPLAAGAHPPAIAFHPTQDPIVNEDGLMHALGCGSKGGCATAAVNGRVRRLTPVECERLQGFPDNYTAIPWKGRAAEHAPDGPRYKAIGNSMAVPVMRWLGIRIHIALTEPHKLEPQP